MHACVLYDLEDFEDPSESLVSTGASHTTDNIYLGGPRGKVFKRPPDFVVFRGLFDFLTDFHDYTGWSLEGGRRRERGRGMGIIKYG